MQVAFIGVGRVGGSIVEETLAEERRADDDSIVGALAVAHDETAFEPLHLVPEANRLLVGPPGGVGTAFDSRDPGERAATAVRDAQGKIVESLTDLVTGSVDVVFVVADLADATAGGGAAALARILRRLFESPVVGLAVLPPAVADAGSARSAVRSLATLDREAAGVLLVDPDAWTDDATGTEATGEEGEADGEEVVDDAAAEEADAPTESGAARASGGSALAAAVASRIGTFLRVAGGSESDAPRSGSTPRLERGTVADTLATGGAAALGVAETRVGGVDVDAGPMGGGGPDADRIAALVDAALDDLSLECDVTTADAGLVAVGAAPVHLDRGAVGRAKRRLVAATGNPAVGSGGYPTPGSDRLAVVVLLAGVSDAPRLVELREAALAVGSPDAGGQGGEDDDAAGGG